MAHESRSAQRRGLRAHENSGQVSRFTNPSPQTHDPPAQTAGKKRRLSYSAAQSGRQIEGGPSVTRQVGALPDAPNAPPFGPPLAGSCTAPAPATGLAPLAPAADESEPVALPA